VTGEVLPDSCRIKVALVDTFNAEQGPERLTQSHWEMRSIGYRGGEPETFDSSHLKLDPAYRY
jgi:hypothetical protein